MDFTIQKEKKNNRGRNLEFRYQVTEMDANDYPFESEWVDTKSEAVDLAKKILRKHSDVAYCMCYNQLNNKYSFRVNREETPVKIMGDIAQK